MTDTETRTADASSKDEANSWEDMLLADMRAHGGRPSGGPLAGQTLLVLYTKGAKSGEPRRAILTYSRDGDAYVVAGTANGRPEHPAWLFNIEADPNVTLSVDNEELQAAATVVRDGPERDRLWDNHVQQQPHFAAYPAQVGSGRVIPMVRLTRKS